MLKSQSSLQESQRYRPVEFLDGSSELNALVRAKVGISRRVKRFSLGFISFVWVLRVLEIVFEGGRLIQRVAPGVRHLERHEFENPKHRDQLGPGRWIL